MTIEQWTAYIILCAAYTCLVLGVFLVSLWPVLAGAGSAVFILLYAMSRNLWKV